MDWEDRYWKAKAILDKLEEEVEPRAEGFRETKPYIDLELV